MSSYFREQAERLIKQRTEQSDRERNSKEYIFRDRSCFETDAHKHVNCFPKNMYDTKNGKDGRKE